MQKIVLKSSVDFGKFSREKERELYLPQSSGFSLNFLENDFFFWALQLISWALQLIFRTKHKKFLVKLQKQFVEAVRCPLPVRCGAGMRHSHDDNCCDFLNRNLTLFCKQELRQILDIRFHTSFAHF